MPTRLGLYGGPRLKYGSFTGKTQAIPVKLKKYEGFRRNVGKMMR